MSRWVAASLVVVLLALPTAVSAKKTDQYQHRYDQVWRAAVRLIRVDQGYPIRDRDESIGYLLFDYKDDGRSYPGSVEVIRVEDQGKDAVRVAIQIPAMPGYIERMLLDKLQKKLVNEYGEPERPTPTPDEEPAEDE
ncbi:MAG: hypothetical protein AAGB93_25495 [Planctomycetota bacterium]